MTDAEKNMGSTNVPSCDESSAEEKLLCAPDAKIEIALSKGGPLQTPQHRWIAAAEEPILRTRLHREKRGPSLRQ